MFKGFLAFILFSFVAVGARAEVRVQEVKREKRYLVIRARNGSTISTGERLETTVGGSVCTFEVYFASGTIGGAKLIECPTFASMQAGAVLRAPGSGGEESTASGDGESEGSGHDFWSGRSTFFGPLLGYSLAKNVNEAATGSVNGTAGALDSTYQGTGALQLGAQVLILASPEAAPSSARFGVRLKGVYSLSRSFDKLVDNKANTTTNLTDLHLKVFAIGADAVLKVGQFVGSLGFNRSFPSISGKDAETTPAKTYSGAFGFQLGAGVTFDRFLIEGFYELIAASYTIAPTNGVTIDATSDKLSGVGLRASVFF